MDNFDLYEQFKHRFMRLYSHAEITGCWAKTTRLGQPTEGVANPR